MNRLWILLLLPLLLGAAPIDEVQLEPSAPRLGEPLLVTLQRPDGNWELSDYPDLTPFQLLEPPRHTEKSLQLRLLPLRPGAATIPPFSLYKGSQVWLSPPVTVDIVDPFTGLDTPTPRHPWPSTTTPFNRWLAALLVSLAGLLVVGWRWTAKRREVGIDNLAAFAERLARQPDSERRGELERILSGWRFGPYRPTTGELDSWQIALTELERTP